MLNAILGTANDLASVFEKFKDKLLDNPDEASIKLASVIDELSMILNFVEQKTVSFLKIHFLDDRSNFIECRKSLLELESGFVSIEAYKARGHCHKIRNIYTKYLDKWFSSVLDPTEADEVRDLFMRMNVADFDMVYGIHELTDWLKDRSVQVLEAIDQGDIIYANQLVMDSRMDIQAERRDIVKALSQLKLLEASFIASAETV